MSRLGNILGWTAVRRLLRTARRGSLVAIERALLLRYPRDSRAAFYIVSSGRNSGDSALRCLQSVHDQEYPRELVTHVYIDDMSEDGTGALVTRWLECHPDHRVRYIERRARMGGTFNNFETMIAAPVGSVIVELNGDDWLPDSGVLAFLSRVYANPAVWMTYNTPVFPSGIPGTRYRPFPRQVVRENDFRSLEHWSCGHLHTFRQELLNHFERSSMIDPATGEYWANADDQALYFSLLELCGNHSRHLHRATCVYNLRAESDQNVDTLGQQQRARAIRDMRRYEPIGELHHAQGGRE